MLPLTKRRQDPFRFLTPTHLFSGQPPEVDFLIQKLANFCAVGPAFTRARVRSTSRGRVGAHRAGRSGQGRQGGGGLLLAAVQGSGQEIRQGGGALSAAHLVGGVLIGAALRSARANRSAVRRDDPAQRRRGGIVCGAAVAESGEKENRQGGPLWPALPVVLSAAVLSSQRRRVVQCGRRWRRSAPRFHVSRNAAVVLFTGRRGGTFAASKGVSTLHLTGLRSRCRALT